MQAALKIVDNVEEAEAQAEAHAHPTSEVRLAAAISEEEKSGVHHFPILPSLPTLPTLPSLPSLPAPANLPTPANLASLPTVTASSSVEAQLPMKLSHKWVSFACRTANVAKPRWNRLTQVWTTSVVGENGMLETISITAAEDMLSVRIVAEWKAPAGSTDETSTARRLATAFVTCMRDGMRRRTMMRTSYEHARILSSLRSSHETR
jgi:hypothetical protein